MLDDMSDGCVSIGTLIMRNRRIEFEVIEGS